MHLRPHRQHAADAARTAVKTLAVALLAVLTFVENGPLLLFAALALSALGDAFLSRDGDRTFLAGLRASSPRICSISACSSPRERHRLVLAESGASSLPPPWQSSQLVMIGLLWRRVKPAHAAADPGLSSSAIVAMGCCRAHHGQRLSSSAARCCSWRPTACSPRKGSWSRRSRRIALDAAAVWALYYVGAALITLGFILK